MKIGIPKEIKPWEGRVALIPAAAAELVSVGHHVMLQQGAGEASGFSDETYLAQGVDILPDAESVYGEAELLLKVKEPLASEVPMLSKEQRLFCYLHLAANPVLTQQLCDVGLTAIAFETVAENRSLPLLVPMSDIAGRISVQVGTHLLHRTGSHGKGVLLGGLPGVDRGRVVILGAGHAGTSAATVAAALGAQVTVFDLSPERLSAMHHLGPNVTALASTADAIDSAVREADLLIGSVLIPGAAAPKLVSAEQVAAMQPGSVVADIAVDQGGCIATSRPTTYDAPYYVESDVIHFCVANMPGAVPKTSSQALSAALVPYLKRLVRDDWREDAALVAGINVEAGKVVHPALI